MEARLPKILKSYHSIMVPTDDAKMTLGMLLPGVVRNAAEAIESTPDLVSARRMARPISYRRPLQIWLQASDVYRERGKDDTEGKAVSMWPGRHPLVLSSA